MQEYFEVTLLIIVALILVVSLSNVGYHRALRKHFNNKKLKIDSRYEIDPTRKSEHFILNIFNQNLNDVRIIGFGFVYTNQSIDYFTSYTQNTNHTNEGFVAVRSRDALKITIDKRELVDILKHYNRGRKKIKTLEAYAIDAQGLKTNIISHEVRSIINRTLKAERLEMKKKQVAMKKEQKTERKAMKKARRVKRRNNLKAFFSRVFMKIRSIRFRKPKKKEDNE